MDWVSIDSARLLSCFGAQIFAEPIVNNRFIGLLGLVQPRAEPGRAWVLKDEAGITRLIAAETSDEVIPLSHPMFPLTPDVVSNLRLRFRTPLLITLHDHQCEQWEEAAAVLNIKYRINLNSYLYAVTRQQFRAAPIDTSIEVQRAIKRCDTATENFIIEFARETMGRSMNRAQAQRAFSSNDFFGSYRGDSLLAIAAATRVSVDSRCISYVYTLPEERGRSLAAQVIARMAKELFVAHGQIFLYADAQNPSSNRLYQKLGFCIISRSKTYA